MIRSLKRKVILLSMISIFTLLTVIVMCMNIVNYNSVISDADDILSLLTENKGAFPELPPNMHGERRWRGPQDMSPETPYESRYFSVLMSSDGNVVFTETSKIAAVDSQKAEEYATEIVKSGKTRGFIDEYRYICHKEAEQSRIIFLDCGRRIDSFHTFLSISIFMSLGGFLIVSLIVTVLSGRIIRPIAESYEKQKRFITDAGHEIKTPLTIINTNIDILEMETGENECLYDIRQQARRLGSLTNDLVMLARMEELENDLQKIEFPISEVVLEAVHPFYTLASQQKKELVCDIEPLLSINGNVKTVQQLVSILMDNALKYSPCGGKLSLELCRQNKTVSLSVSNTTEADVEQENLTYVFDRFYRADASRNSETGGHGIGLSVAKAIVAAHGGRIQATAPDSRTFRITASFPM